MLNKKEITNYINTYLDYKKQYNNLPLAKKKYEINEYIDFSIAATINFMDIEKIIDNKPINVEKLAKQIDLLKKLFDLLHNEYEE